MITKSIWRVLYEVHYIIKTQGEKNTLRSGHFKQGEAQHIWHQLIQFHEHLFLPHFATLFIIIYTRQKQTNSCFLMKWTIKDKNGGNTCMHYFQTPFWRQKRYHRFCETRKYSVHAKVTVTKTVITVITFHTDCFCSKIYLEVMNSEHI